MMFCDIPRIMCQIRENRFYRILMTKIWTIVSVICQCDTYLIIRRLTKSSLIPRLKWVYLYSVYIGELVHGLHAIFFKLRRKYVCLNSVGREHILQVHCFPPLEIQCTSHISLGLQIMCNLTLCADMEPLGGYGVGLRSSFWVSPQSLPNGSISAHSVVNHVLLVKLIVPPPPVKKYYNFIHNYYYLSYMKSMWRVCCTLGDTLINCETKIYESLEV